MKSEESGSGSPYHIEIKEALRGCLTDQFDNLNVMHLEDGGTLIAGSFADQAALRGLLDYLWNLNLTLISLRRIDP